MDLSIIQELTKRLDLIPDNQEERPKLYINLFGEFLRRLTYIYDYSKTKKPYGLNFYLSESIIEEIHADEITHHIKSEYCSKFGSGAYNLIHTWIFWELSKNKLKFYDGIKGIELFEPILILLERGGKIDRERKMFEVGCRSYYIEKSYAPPLDMSNEYLDSLDQ